MNCIDCEWLVRWWTENGKEHFVECSKASPDVRNCGDFKNAKRKIIKKENNYVIREIDDSGRYRG